MATTIALKDDTYFLLSMMKDELNTESYDETIQKLIGKTKRLKKSYFGKARIKKPFVREEIDRFA